jgi:hypothetical protein
MGRASEFFHGSTHDIGNRVVPGAAVGHSNYDYSEDGDLRHGGYNPNEHVHGVPDEQDAWEFAGYKGRRSVYKMLAPNEGKEDPNWEGARVWPHPLQVVDKVDIAHPGLWGSSRIHGVQGTLPPVDWNSYGSEKTAGGDLNNHALYKEKTTVAGRALEHLLRPGHVRPKAEPPLQPQQIPGQGTLF